MNRDEGETGEKAVEPLGMIGKQEIEKVRRKWTEREAETAAKIAKWIVLSFCLSIAACFFFLFWSPTVWGQGSAFSDSLELFKTVSAVLSGPLGFVLGYYFARK